MPLFNIDFTVNIEAVVEAESADEARQLGLDLYAHVNFTGSPTYLEDWSIDMVGGVEIDE